MAKPPAARILVVDDEKSIRNTLRDILEFENYAVTEAADGEEALKLLSDQAFDLVLCDIKMPKHDGMEVLREGLKLQYDVQFIMISGHGNVETAVESTRLGAFDFLEKPPDLNRLLVSVRNALDKNTLVNETKELKQRVGGIQELIGDSDAMQRVKETIERVAPIDARVLITGENGTGKELIARWLHALSTRKEGSLVEVNCAAIPSELIESELFGHEKGAFTGANKQRIGKFEQAHGGTLFLDEIGDMSLEAQAKVLRVLQENRITRVGAETKDIEVDVRIIAATNKDLLLEIENKRFREDLYHRLSVILIESPALRHRKDDIPALVDHFLNDICNEYHYPLKSITKGAINELMKRDWPGNVRELRNVVERLVILSGKRITETDVHQLAPISRSKKSAEGLFESFKTWGEFKEHVEKQFILRKLQKNNWNISKTSDEMDIQRSHLYNKIEKYQLQREEVAQE